MKPTLCFYLIMSALILPFISKNMNLLEGLTVVKSQKHIDTKKHIVTSQISRNHHTTESQFFKKKSCLPSCLFVQNRHYSIQRASAYFSLLLTLLLMSQAVCPLLIHELTSAVGVELGQWRAEKANKE